MPSAGASPIRKLLPALPDHRPPPLLRQVVEESGAHPTHPGAETILTQFSDDMEQYASAYGELADALWDRTKLTRCPCCL